MVDLFEYWVDLPSSIDISNPERNFAFAIWRARRTATQFLIQRFEELRVEVSLDAEPLGSEDGHGSSWLEDKSLTPEELVCEQDELQQVRSLLSALSTAELRAWLSDYLAGVPSPRGDWATQQRRSRGVRRLKACAAARGLVA